MSIAISLGWNCGSAIYSVNNYLRPTKKDGYKTCPFDLMNTNYVGLIECIYNDFEGFTDVELLQFSKDEKYHSGDKIIYNKKYKFLFNHESPGHANLYETENWSEGIEHFTKDYYKNFVIRYNNRINNFRSYMNSGLYINFIIEKPNDDFSELEKCLKKMYPNLKYSIINIWKNDDVVFYGVHKQMGFGDDYTEFNFLRNI